MPERYTIPDLVDALVEHFAVQRVDGLQAPTMTTRTRITFAAEAACSICDTVRAGCAGAPRSARSCARRGSAPTIFIYPLFVVPGEGQRREVGSMPGVYQMSVDEIVKEAAAAKADGVPGVLLFGLPETKDAVGSGAADPEGPVQTAVRALKREVPGLLVVTDVCLCEYTSHGHCGIVDGEDIVNDVTVEELARAALSHAAAGADIVAPSDMMDGRVGRIRETLDDAGFSAGRDHGLRGEVLLRVLRPVPRSRRLGAGVRRPPLAPDGSRPTSRKRCARSRSISRKGPTSSWSSRPCTYLDVISRVKDEFGVPTAAYHVSGEYAMLKAAARNGWIDEPRAMMETLTSIRRAGADIVITYYAREAARALA